jgi:antitoxin component YwqK of YwqJK toxin-antitoxin module
MKRVILTSFLLASFLFSNAQSFELHSSLTDTINMTDANGKKKGKWVIMGRHKPGSGYHEMQKIEEGMYKDNKRVGVWKEYYSNSNLKSTITYIDGKPHGSTTLFYENGNLKEEGTWINNRWIGNYKLIDENGTVTEKVFDDKGKEISSKITPPKNSVPSKKK